MSLHMTEDVEVLVVAAYQQGMPIHAMVDEFHVSNKTIFNVLHRRGVSRRRRCGPARAEFTSEEMERLESLRREGWSKVRLGDEFGAGQDRIRRALIELGLNDQVRRYDSKDRVITNDGYAYVLVDDDDIAAPMRGSIRYVLEHRVVMAHAIGRPLRSTETVHHLNGVRDDNRIENLQLRQGKHGKGQVLTCADCGSHNLVPMEL